MIRCIRAIVLAMAVVTLAAASASADSGGVAGKGLKFGVNSADLTGAGVEPGLGPQVGFTAGAFVTLGLTDRFFVQPEILYTEKGAESESRPNPYEYRFAYIEVPVMFKVTLASRGAAFRPYIYAGPFVGAKVSARVETYLDRRQEEANEANLPSVRGIDAGFAVGVGADLKAGPGRVLVDLRYGKSLVNALTTADKVRHRVFSISLGYSFD
jgi:hypothetical protein